VKVTHFQSFPIRRPKGKNIFLVTALSLHGEEIQRTRAWGWYPNAKDAATAVIENHTDLFEAGYYTHAVIEEVPSGLIALAKSERWFKASYSRKRGNNPLVKEVKKPSSLTQTINFGFG